MKLIHAAEFIKYVFQGFTFGVKWWNGGDCDLLGAKCDANDDDDIHTYEKPDIPGIPLSRLALPASMFFYFFRLSYVFSTIVQTPFSTVIS